MSSVTIYKDMNSKEPFHISIQSALARIRDGESADLVRAIRQGSGDKKKLPCIIFAGKVEGKTRKDDDVKTHSGFIVLDWDKVDVQNKKQQLKNDPYIYASWISPSGNGVKALVKVPPSIEHHEEHYNSFLSRYPELDSTSRNIARLCFESYDPELTYRPNSLVWDKRFTKETKINNSATRTTARNNHITSVAVGMVRASLDGEKHDQLRNAAILLGGYIGAGRLDAAYAEQILTDEITAKNPKSLQDAIKTIRDGLKFGKLQPLHEIKKIEKKQEFLRREDGTPDFLASNSEMDEYERSVINGTLEMGLPTGLNGLDRYWVLKKNHLVFFGGIDNVGKSVLVWYLSVLAAMNHGWKIAIYSAENSDGQVRQRLKELYIGKPLVEMNSEELMRAGKFVEEYFRIFTSKKNWSWEDFLIRAEITFDEGFEFDVLIAEPWNAMEMSNDNMYFQDVKSLNLLRVFKENYASVWIADHASTSAARNKDDEGYVKVPWKSDISSGQIKANKTDDFIMVHRRVNHPTDWKFTELHVMKIKVTETGGQHTPKDDPFLICMNTNRCGYRQVDSRDAVEQHWKSRLPYKDTELIEAMTEKYDAKEEDDGFPDLGPYDKGGYDEIV